jgi:hypothetical protein
MYKPIFHNYINAISRFAKIFPLKMPLSKKKIDRLEILLKNLVLLRLL